MKNTEELLKDALSPTMEMSSELKNKILLQITEEKEHNMTDIRKHTFKKRIPTAAAIAIALLMVSSVSAFAAWRYLSASDVATRIGDTRLAWTFAEDDEATLYEVQSYGGYDVALIGLVSGDEISEQLVTYNGEIISDSTYAVVAIKNSDGTPMPDTADENYGKENFLVSPYIEGYDPAIYNIFSLRGGGCETVVENGIQYKIASVENIEAFADHTIYLGVSEGTFYDNDAYDYDAKSGRISRNEDYTRLNALFTLSIDPARADRNKAEEIISAIENPTDDKTENEAYIDTDVYEFMNRLTADNIEGYAEVIESTIQVIEPDENGNYSYGYELDNGASGSGTQNINVMFPDGKAGMCDKFDFSFTEDGLSGLLIETHTLNEDGTITYAVYIPKEENR